MTCAPRGGKPHLWRSAPVNDITLARAAQRAGLRHTPEFAPRQRMLIVELWCRACGARVGAG